jgi:predicted Zn-dependent protease
MTQGLLSKRLSPLTFVLFIATSAVTVACQSLDQSNRTESTAKTQKSSLRLPELLKQSDQGLAGKAEQYEAFLAAERLASQKDYAAAQVFYQAVYDKTPTLVAGLSLARILTFLGKSQEAENVVRKVHLLFPKEPQPKLAEAYLVGLHGSPDEALALYRQTYDEHPDNEEVAARYVEALLAADKKQEAESILRKSIRKIPESPYFLLKLARIKFQAKEFTQAKTLLDSLLRVDPDNIEGWTLAGFIALEEKKDEDAEGYFRSAYEKQPENDALAKYYVAQLLKLNRLEEASRLLLRIDQSDSPETPIDPDLKFQLAAVMFQLEDFENARDRFVALASKAEDPGRMYYFAGQCEESMKKFKEATEFYNRVAKESDFFVPATQRRIITHLELGEDAQARLLLTEYSQTAKKDAAYIRFYAGVRARLKEHKEALKAIREASPADRKTPEMRYLEAVYLEYTVSREASLQALEKLIHDHPKFSPALNHLGYSLVEQGVRLEFATKILEQAVASEPKNGFFLDSLGWAYYKRGQLKQAEESLLRALELEPDEPVILEHLAELKFKQERFDMSLRYFEQAMTIFEEAPPWKVNADDEWKNSRTRVKKRIEELLQMALPKKQERQ